MLTDALSRGKDVLLDIDVQGAEQLVDRFPDAVTIFVMPPSTEALRSRLLQRGADSQEVIERRMAAAEEEIRCSSGYRHIVVNDRLETALAELATLVEHYRK